MAWQQEIDGIMSDNQSGSTQLLARIMTFFLGRDLSRKSFQRSLQIFEKLDPSMAVVHHFLDHVKAVHSDDLRHEIHEYIDEWTNAENSTIVKTSRQLEPGWSKFLTHSRSGLVSKVVKKLSNRIQLLYQTESFPGLEGRVQHKYFEQVGIKSLLIEDEEVRIVMQDVDVVLLGMDQYSDSQFVNKMGSQSIVDFAGESATPVLILGDTRKKVSEISPGDSTIFEQVSLNNVTKIITN